MMTRRGSLVYYLASWICGGLFLTVAMVLQERASPQGMGIAPSGAGAAIITTYFLVLVFGAFLSVVFAFLLRLFMDWLRAESLWKWALGGILISMPMSWGVRWASRATDAAGLEGAGRQIAVFLFLGVRGIAENITVRLSDKDKIASATLNQSLELLKNELHPGNLDRIIKNATQMILSGGFDKIDYLAICNAQTLENITHWDAKTALIGLVAAYIDGIRLIDNRILN